MKIFALASLSLAACMAAASVASAQTGGGGGGVVVLAPRPAPSPEQLFDFGKVEGLTYANEYFGISFTAPEGWAVRDEKTMRAMQETARGLFKDEKNATIKRELEDSVNRTVPLFVASKSERGTPSSFNATLACAAERIPTALIKTPRDYYDAMLHAMKLSQEVDAVVVEAFRIKRIGGADFGVFTLKLSSNAGIVMQKQLISIKSPYALGIVFAYTDESDAPAFEKVMSSIKARF
jgi:hypothetical protein